jgi:hypothetical protein
MIKGVKQVGREEGDDVRPGIGDRVAAHTHVLQGETLLK